VLTIFGKPYLKQQNNTVKARILVLCVIKMETEHGTEVQESVIHK